MSRNIKEKFGLSYLTDAQERNCLVCQKPYASGHYSSDCLNQLRQSLAALEAELERYRLYAENEQKAREADACTECKGRGEIGYMTETELGPEGDSEVCSACAGSGSQAVADVIESWGDSEQIDRLSEALKWAVEFIRCNVPTHTDYPDFHNAYDLTRNDSIMGIFTETRHRNESLTEQVAALSLELEAARAKARDTAKATIKQVNRDWWDMNATGFFAKYGTTDFLDALDKAIDDALPLPAADEIGGGDD